MAISEKEVLNLFNEFHDATMIQKASAKEQAEFFLYPEPRIILLHGEDLTLQQNYDIHQKLIDEQHKVLPGYEITQLTEKPEKARIKGAVYWQGRLINSEAIIKCIVGEDWIVQRAESGKIKFVVYINSFHYFLPDSAPIAF